MRRPPLTFVTLLLVALSWAAAAGASEAAQSPEPHMDVVQVQGAIDPVVARLIKDSIERAQTNGATVVILQVDSHGALDTDPVALVDAVYASKVPVAVWVGPGKSAARGAAAGLGNLDDTVGVRAEACPGQAGNRLFMTAFFVRTVPARPGDR